MAGVRLIDKKFTQAEMDEMQKPMEEDLIYFYELLEMAVEELIKQAVEEGWTPEQLISEVEGLFEQPINIYEEVEVRKSMDELTIGTLIEREHTDDMKTAQKIAQDHINENPEYYSKLIDAGLVEPSELMINKALEDSPEFHSAMREYGEGKLKTSAGDIVNSIEQAKAIAYSKAKRATKCRDSLNKINKCMQELNGKN
jgi:hypothetical protein